MRNKHYDNRSKDKKDDRYGREDRRQKITAEMCVVLLEKERGKKIRKRQKEKKRIERYKKTKGKGRKTRMSEF